MIEDSKASHKKKYQEKKITIIKKEALGMIKKKIKTILMTPPTPHSFIFGKRCL